MIQTKFRLEKFSGNPILGPHESNLWENLSVCNPAAWHEDGKFYLLYRAAGNDSEHKIHFGLAESPDGRNFQRVSDKPVLSPSADGPDAGCVEDPRIVKMDGHFYITYAYRPLPPGRYWLNPGSLAFMPGGPEDAPVFYRDNVTQSGLLMSEDLRSFHRLGRLTNPLDDNRDVILFPGKVNGKYVMLHRSKRLVGESHGCKHPSIWISFSDDLLSWDDGRLLLKGESWWAEKVGGAAPPLLADEGWIMLYHGVKDGVYRTGVLLLDKDDPSKILSAPPDFIMEPEHDYEVNGLYGSCVFPTGNVIVNGALMVYYGGADKHCCLAACSVSGLLSWLLKFSK